MQVETWKEGGLEAGGYLIASKTDEIQHENTAPLSHQKLLSAIGVDLG